MKKLILTFPIIAFLFFINITNVHSQEFYIVNPISQINTKFYDEFSLVPYKDGYVYCTNISQNAFIFRLDSLGNPLLDLYFIKQKNTKKWISPSFFSKEINSKYYEGPFTFTNNFKTIYFSRNNRNQAGIFYSEMGTLDWSKPEPFKYNDENYIVTHPSISDDGKNLFFIANFKDSYGGKDIYSCRLLSDGQWSQPQNLGTEVNSVSEELYPFIAKNNRLYFASNRPGSYGKLDIYYTLQINGKWVKPIHMPAPINTKEEDFAFYTDSIGKNGFLSSTRNKRSSYSDIYDFTFNFPDLSNAIAVEENIYTYEFEEQSNINTDTTSFKYEWDFGDGEKYIGKLLKIDHTFKKVGDYLVKLNVIDTITGNTIQNQTSSLFQVRDTEQPVITCPDNDLTGNEIKFDALKTYLPDKKIQGYYWDFGDGNIETGKEVVHTFQYPGKYKVILGVSYLDENKKIIIDSRFKEILIKQDASK